jgi:hydrogenase maturation factor
MHSKQADVDYGGGVMRTVLVAGHKADVGDYVLVQMGIIIKTLSEDEANAAQKAWQKDKVTE